MLPYFHFFFYYKSQYYNKYLKYIIPLCIYNYPKIINIIYLYLGRTSLSYAAEEGRTDVVKILVENGADINDKDNYG